MARTAPVSNAYEDQIETNDGDWRALRANLVSLLKQVDDKELGILDEPARKADDSELPLPMRRSEDRHAEALNSVRMAVERFSAPKEEVPTPKKQKRRNPQAELQSAIHQIRERTDKTSEPSRASSGKYKAPSESKHLAKLTQAIGSITARLEHFEAELKTSKGTQGEISEIGSQVSQLTNVVEMLANAVGETGQVKRLENQIGQLAQLVTSGSQPEISSLTQRIDEVAATVERLADLQVQQMGRDVKEETNSTAKRDSAMTAIENGIRSIYDRIDLMENSYAIKPDDLERITHELSAVTQAVSGPKETTSTDVLLPLVEALGQQVSRIEAQGTNSAVGDLKADVTALHDVVADAMEPRFAALESQLNTLSGQVNTDNTSSKFNEIENQIRTLISQMGHTGQQLDSLKAQYSEKTANEHATDPEALAALVAQKTSEEFARIRSAEQPNLSEVGLKQIEARLSKLFGDKNTQQSPEALSDVQLGISRVDKRLSRLEDLLSKAQQQAPKATTPAASVNKPRIAVTPVKATAKPTQQKPARPTQAEDSMPMAPLADRPLRDAGFDEPQEIFNPADTKTSAREPILNVKTADTSVNDVSSAQTRLASLATKLEQNGRLEKTASVDFDATEVPAKPRSSFDTQAENTFNTEDAFKDAALNMPLNTPPATPVRENSTTLSDRNTFIAAARRAAQQQGTELAEEESQSLIGRAFARFQSKNKSEDVFDDVETAHHVEVAEPTPAPETFAEEEYIQQDEHAFEEMDEKPGIFARHRRTLLLSACVVAAMLLAANLIVQRTSEPAQTIAPAAEPILESTPPLETSALDLSAFTPSPMLDPQPTGSIDPFIKIDLTRPSQAHQGIPDKLMAATQDLEAGLDATTTGAIRKIDQSVKEIAPTVKLGLPPEELGPIELRQAAADGDAKAQFEVAAIYTEGRALTQDYESASVWYERSAAQGFAPAQYRLGNLYEHGNGVDKDLEQARLWYQRSAEAGNRMAMHNLAALYAGGALGEQEFLPAAEWFERAAAQGMTDSQFNLGMLYARGLGVKQDLATSFKWFSLAANSGDQDAAKARDDVARSLDTQTMQQLQDDLNKWTIYPIAIDANFAPIGTWSDKFDPGASITEKTVVTRVQTALSKLGYDIGNPDGVMGPKTTQAIQSFERATGMKELGLINPRLLAVLGSQPV